VYGEGAETPFKEDGALGVPASPYASTKLAGEMLCRNFAAEIPHVAILRLFTVYGPRQRPDLAIHKFARLMLDDEPIPIYGSTGSFRDYTFVSDIVSGLEASLTVEDPWLVCNLGSGRPIELGEMIKALESALEVKATVEHLPSQDGDLFGTWASITRAQRKLGYQPQYTFSEGVESFAEWVVSSRRTDR
jgi:UDP-glucuronate 4-epimerase